MTQKWSEKSFRRKWELFQKLGFFYRIVLNKIMIKEVSLPLESMKNFHFEEITQGTKKYQNLIYARAVNDLMRTFYPRISANSIANLLVSLNSMHNLEQRGKESRVLGKIVALNEEERQILRAIYPE